MTTRAPTCHELAAYLDEHLRVAEIRDWKNALNGLQVENRVPIRRIAAAVDASEATIRGAIAQECQLLIVHHGLFWAGNRAVTGRRYRRLRLLFDAELAVYGSHLPLDVHPDLGNNVLLARRLGIEPEGGFGSHEGRDIGVHGPCDIDRDEMHRILEDVLGGSVRMIAGGPRRIRRAGILTGSGGGAVDDALSAGLDALITGEGTHHTFVDAMEGGLNLYYGGHYATETWGVRALAEHVAGHFGLEWRFIDAPTGM
jgi:dinuclear metal center YbgI/SA1388 family protein